MQIDGETMKTVTGFLFLVSKITEDGDYSYEIKKKKNVFLGEKKKKAHSNLDSILKSRDITLPTRSI